MNRLRVCGLALAALAGIQSPSIAHGDAVGQRATEDVDFSPAIKKIVASAEHDFTDIAGTKGTNEYKTSLRINYHNATFGGLIRPGPDGEWSCTFPVLLTLDKAEADAAFSEWTSALSSVLGKGQALTSGSGPESRVRSHSDLERVGADEYLSIWGAERGRTGVRLFYTVDRGDMSYYIEVVFSERSKN
jgi:hypothetical protein